MTKIVFDIDFEDDIIYTFYLLYILDIAYPP